MAIIQPPFRSKMAPAWSGSKEDSSHENWRVRACVKSLISLQA